MPPLLALSGVAFVLVFAASVDVVLAALVDVPVRVDAGPAHAVSAAPLMTTA